MVKSPIVTIRALTVMILGAFSGPVLAQVPGEPPVIPTADVDDILDFVGTLSADVNSLFENYESTRSPAPIPSRWTALTRERKTFNSVESAVVKARLHAGIGLTIDEAEQYKEAYILYQERLGERLTDWELISRKLPRPDRKRSNGVGSYTTVWKRTEGDIQLHLAVGTGLCEVDPVDSPGFVPPYEGAKPWLHFVYVSIRANYRSDSLFRMLQTAAAETENPSLRRLWEVLGAPAAPNGKLNQLGQWDYSYLWHAPDKLLKLVYEPEGGTYLPVVVRAYDERNKIIRKTIPWYTPLSSAGALEGELNQPEARELYQRLISQRQDCLLYTSPSPRD